MVSQTECVRAHVESYGGQFSSSLIIKHKVNTFLKTSVNITKGSLFCSKVRAVCKVAKKKSTSAGVEGGGEIKPPHPSSSSSTKAAAMTKKKKKKNNKGVLTKCNICLNQYNIKNLDKHMHSRTHHEAIERLKGGEMHKCWACDVSLSGLEQFSRHIECEEHNSKLFSLKQRTERGFKVDYSNDELKDLCVQRDHNRMLIKMQRHKEKLNKFRERKAAKMQEAFYQKPWAKRFSCLGSHSGTSAWTDDKSVTFPPNNENKQETMNAEAVPESKSEEGAQTEGSVQKKSITLFTKKDVDFTSDELAQRDMFSSWEEDKSQQDKVVLGQKRSCDDNTFDSPPVRKQLLRDVPSTMPRFTPSEEAERVSQPPSAAVPLTAPEQDHLSTMLKNIRKSLNKERPQVGPSKDPDPELRPETTLSDIPRFSSKPPQMSRKSQRCDAQACKTKRTPSPHKQDDNLLTSTGAEPQEKPEPSQTRNVLPTLLNRSVSKTEANKPNLKAARGIRTCQKPGLAAKTQVLKPALQKLISSKSSQWRINWKEMYQEATHRKLQREKGMPRFGIELVTPLPPDPQEDDLQHFELDEGFQWASIECDAVTPPCSGEDWERQDLRTSSTNHTLWSAEEKTTDSGENPSTSGMSRLSQLENADLHEDNTSETQALARRQNSTPLDSVVCVKTEKLDDYSTETTLEKSDHDRIPPIPNAQIKQEIQDFPHTDTLNKNLPKKPALTSSAI
ncbi:zinc finger protein 106 isoform X2 [Hemibagrus wyckioides]|uniref:zinc finger protein 106 isoform X2 n=1 Tax=Hemibagrus wyckioides TaxID=337641 RepID=UPI00266B528A|nr:zinc finger protein 106 isoform X2 [Hemibagrus wyckioides]